MKKISFIKMSGAGNDFIIINKDIYPELDFNNGSVKKLCDRRNGIGADGLITIAGSAGQHDFIMDYYNSDGSTGSLCGNGARCAVRYAGYSGLTKDKFVRFLSNNIEYSGSILSEDLILVNFNPPSVMKLNLNIKTAGQSVKCSFIDTGSPHVVINIKDVLENPADKNSFYNDLDSFPVFNLGREIRYLDDFSPKGTNVNFIKVGKNIIQIRTYERGVEDETLSCGTGSVAAALVANFLYDLNPPVSLLTRGEDYLTVDFKTVGNDISNLSLSGPAKITFSGEFLYNTFFN
jgi:diaminopimelate epimerase